MHYIDRIIESTIKNRLKAFPGVAILGPRQCGKSTLARHILHEIPGALYLDLELSSDLNKIREPELFLGQHEDALICFDEIQRAPGLFPVLRSFIDRNSKNGRFLFLGSASRDLISQSSETLAGRLSYIELSPFMLTECLSDGVTDVRHYWLRGGFPRSLLAENDQASFQWRYDFIRSFVERDVLRVGQGASSDKIDRLLRMCAHISGQSVNYSKLGSSLDMSDNTVRHYLELLNGAFLVRMVRPYFANMKKRLVKSPKIYIRDSGILHALLGIETFDHLLAHPDFGASWEGLVIENVLAVVKPSIMASYYRTAKGEEADLVLESGNKRFLIECKSSTAPQAGSSLMASVGDIHPDHTWIIAPVEGSYPLSESITVASLAALFTDIRLKDILL
jgi:predicted AAA+ superfamily ATPase